MIVSTVLVLLFCVVGSVTAAAPEFDPGGRIKDETGLASNGDLPTVVINIVNILLSLLGLVAVVFIIFGGYTYLTAAGNQQRLDQAKGIIKNAVIGMVIVLLSYAITSFFFNTTVNVTTTPTP